MVDLNEPIVGEEFDVFISYAHADKEADSDRSPAQALAEMLQSEGYTVWWDRDLIGSVDWLRTLSNKVHFARKVIALVSPRWLASTYCRNEMFAAYRVDGKLVPLMIADCALPGEISHIQYIEAKGKLVLYKAPILAALGIAPSNRPKAAAPARLSEDDVYLEGLPTGADKLFGRDIEMSTLVKAWDSCGQANPAAKTNAVVLHAIGGAGKSALLRSFLDALAAKGYPGAEKVYGWSAYSQGSGDNRNADADGFITRALRFFGYDIDAKPITDPVERGRLLAKLIRKQRTLLVLDGLEPLQDLPHVNDGRLKDRGLQALITSLAKENPGLLVITSRQELPELAQMQPPKIINHALDQLSERAGGELLKHLGVHGREKELMAAVHEVGGHALSVSLLGTYLSAVCAGDVARRDTLRLGDLTDDAAEALGDRRAKRAQRIMDAYVERFAALEKSQSAGEGDPERMILSLIGLFDRPADAEALAAVLAEPPIPGLTDGWHKLSQQSRDLRWTYAVKRLRALKLLSNADANNPGGLDAHPVVRQHFGQKLKEDQPEAYREANKRLYHHYRSVGLPEQFRTPEGFGLVQLARVIDEADEFQKIISALADGSFPDHLRNRLPSGLRTATSEQFQTLLRTFDDNTFFKAQGTFLPDTIEAMQPLFAAIAHGCAAGLYPEVFDEVYGDRVIRRTDFINGQLGAFGADLGALAHFFQTRWNVPASELSAGEQSSLLNYVGYALRGLGRLREAVEPMRANLDNDVKKGRWDFAAIQGSTLGEVLLDLGDIGEAIVVSRSAIVYADKSEKRFLQLARRANLAGVLIQAANVVEAEELLREAEQMHAQLHPELPRLTSHGSYIYCQLLFDAGRYHEVFERAATTLRLAENLTWYPLRDRALDAVSYGQSLHLNGAAKEWGMLNRDEAAMVATFLKALRNATFGNGGRASRLPSAAQEALREEHEEPNRSMLNGLDRPGPEVFLDLAVEGLRRAGVEHLVPRGLLARAAFRRDCRDFDGAQEDLVEVHEIASRGGMRLFLTDYYLELGRLGFACDPKLSCPDSRRNIEACVRYAHDLIQATGYHRRNGELAALREALDCA